MNWVLTELAKDEIETLAAFGHIATPQEVLDIQRLSLDALQESDDGGKTATLARGKPVEMGAGTCTWLYPPTLAGEAFRDDMLPMAKKDFWKVAITAYAHCFGRDESRIYQRGKEAFREVRNWARRQRCTADEMVDALDELYRDEGPNVATKEDKARGGSPPLALMASALTGTPPSIWETQVSIGSVVTVIETAVAQHMAMAGAATEDNHLQGLAKMARYTQNLLEKDKEGNGKEQS